MKLVFKEKYLSIDQFNDVEIPDFSVVTGVNGSGKSHLLQSIERKKVQIEGMESASVVFFNYETFKLENESAFTAHEIAAEREGAWNYFDQQIKAPIASWRESYLLEFYTDLKEICITKKKDLWFLQKDDIGDDIKYGQLQNYKKAIKDHFNTPHLKGNQQAQAILVLIKGLKFSIDYIEKAEFIEIYKPFYFKSDFLPQQLGKIIWDYYERLYHNQVNEFENTKHGGSRIVLSQEEFSKKYGDKPWEILNKILKSFDNLDYQVNSPDGTDIFLNYELKLIHTKKESLEIGFDLLSSGERVLMALVASIYKSLSDKHFPDILLLDEIDASLHPSMIKNLLEVIHNIFIKKGIKVILVTHSPTTVALSPSESIFVMNKEGIGRIEKKDKKDALSILSEGFASLSQDDSDLSISYNLSKSPRCIILTEGITDKIIIETAWQKLNPKTEAVFYIQDCFDASFLRNMLSRGGDMPDGIFVKYTDKIFIALFDFDAEGYGCWNQLSKNFSIESGNDPEKCLSKKHKSHNAHVLLLPVPKDQEMKKQVIQEGINTYKDKSHLPIELLFHNISSLSKNFTTESASGGGTIIRFVGDKRKFAENIVNLGTNDFDNFKPLFGKIEELIKASK